MKNTSISLGSHFEKFIRAELSSGRYHSVSEVIRTALRLLETEEQKIKRLTKAIEAGEESALIDNFDPRANLKSLKKSRK